MRTPDPDKWLRFAAEAIKDLSEDDRPQALRVIARLARARQLPVTELSSSPLLRSAIVGVLYRRHLAVDMYDEDLKTQVIRKI